MGHKSIVMTERYAHLIPDQKIEAVKLLAEKFRWCVTTAGTQTGQKGSGARMGC
jgi:hypothetical protein